MLNAYALDTLQLCQGLMVQKRVTDKVSLRIQIYSLIYSFSSFQCVGYQDQSIMEGSSQANLEKPNCHTFL